MARIRDELAERGLAPSRARGQNFLRSADTARRLVEASGLCAQDAAIEIGPGLGQLTAPIAAVARETVAIEVDRGLYQALCEREFAARGPVEILHEDVLRADLGGLVRRMGEPVVLLGNLPYRISGRLLGKLLGPRNPFRRWAFMLQREVAGRLLAEPGSPEYGLLSVWARLFSRAERVLDLGPDEFVPRPKVRSSFLVFEPNPDCPAILEVPVLRATVRAAFQRRRKGLRSALRGVVEASEAGLARAGIDPLRRGETLSESEFAALANAISEARAERDEPRGSAGR